jgi:hypothetical protein
MAPVYQGAQGALTRADPLFLLAINRLSQTPHLPHQILRSAEAQDGNLEVMPNHSRFERVLTSGILPNSSLFFPDIHPRLARPSQQKPHTVSDPRSFNLEDTRMRAVWILAGILAAASAGCFAQTATQEDPVRLVSETVYNELQDHSSHGYWRYWVRQQAQNGSYIEVQVETVDGPVGHLLQQNGQPLDEQHEQLESARLLNLRNSPSQQASHRQAFIEDDQRIGRILALLPDAFLYQDAGIENDCRRLRYTPNPKYSAHGMEARVFHQLRGDLWIDLRMKRIRRFDGHLDDNVDFAFGVLGRVSKGSWFSMTRAQVSPKEWKTDHFESHVNGRALLFKTIARDITEVRGGFETVPPAMTLVQGLKVLEQTVAASEALKTDGRISPAALVTEKSGGPGR